MTQWVLSGGHPILSKRSCSQLLICERVTSPNLPSYKNWSRPPAKVTTSIWYQWCPSSLLIQDWRRWQRDGLWYKYTRKLKPCWSSHRDLCSSHRDLCKWIIEGCLLLYLKVVRAVLSSALIVAHYTYNPIRIWHSHQCSSPEKGVYSIDCFHNAASRDGRTETTLVYRTIACTGLRVGSVT